MPPSLTGCLLLFALATWGSAQMITLSGSVFAPGPLTTPVSGASVHAMPLPPADPQMPDATLLYTSLTNGSGEYILQLPAGNYAVRAVLQTAVSDELVMVLDCTTTQHFMLVAHDE